MTTISQLHPKGATNPLIAIATRKVLVIDDQRNARVILEGVVRCIDPYIEVKAYGNPLEAIEWARANTPDLVLTDYKMREIDGIETIKRLRQLPTCTDVPIVMLTVSPDTTVRHAAFDAGVTDFLIKPYDHYECRARCRNLLILREQHMQIKDRTRLLESEISAAIKHMRERERETILFAGNLAEYHAHQPGYRLLRIACYSRLIAEGMGLERDMAERIELASTLHDVGKICIAEATLLAEEHAADSPDDALQEHTDIGYRLLANSTSDCLQMAAEIALHHHERYDGKGYPKGLKGRDIPLPARIVTVAEAFDILTSPARNTIHQTVAGAMSALMAKKGNALDPVCVEALGSQIEAAREIVASYRDTD